MPHPPRRLTPGGGHVGTHPVRPTPGAHVALRRRPPRHPLCRPRLLPPLPATPSNDDDAGVDIDALAAALAAAAGARRAAGESLEDAASTDDDSDGAPPPLTRSAASPFDAASAAARAAEVFAEHPDAGFDPDSVELLQELGRVSWRDDGGGGDTSAPTVAAVAYAGRYTPAAPFQPPTLVLVKEYAPFDSATALAANELQVGIRLNGGALPARKWHAATGRGPPRPRPPAVHLLGYFRAASIAAPDAAAPATWLVFRWEGLAPLSFYASADQPPPAGLASLVPRSSEAAAADRARMVRAVVAGAVRALAAVHAAGVAHGSLGGGCILLSTYNDAEWRRVSVTLDNFGFAQMRLGGGGDAAAATAAAAADDDSPVALAQAADARALAKLAVETAAAALGAGGDAKAVARATVDAVAAGGGGVAARAAVAADPAVAAAVAAFDDDGGWDVIAQLASGGRLGEAAASDFVVRADRG